MSIALRCAVVVEELAEDKCTVQRRTSLKDSKVTVVRNDVRQIILRVTPGDEIRSSKCVLRSFGYPVMQLDLFKRFIESGKATISLPLQSVRLLLSNCPPDKLRLFLATLRIKLKAAQTLNSRKPVVPDAPPTALSLLEEVSPLRLPSTSRLPQGMISPNISRIGPSKSKHAPLVYAKDQNAGPSHMSTPVRCNKKNNKPELGRTFSHVVPSWTKKENIAPEDGKQLQLKVVDAVKNGHNVFCTGGAGTGKSYLIRRIVGLLPPEYTAITASTGTAANLIGGTTIHTFSGIGAMLSEESEDTPEAMHHWFLALQARLQNVPSVVARWRRLRHLIIDEISMLSSQLFTRLDLLAREIRQPENNDSASSPAFGGVQLIVFGDFYQLPPVVKSKQTHFAFESQCWKQCHFSSVELSRSWRQSDDPRLAKLLATVREEECPDWVRALLQSRCLASDTETTEGELIPTRLCTHRSDAEAWNLRMLNALRGDAKVFRARDSESKHARNLDTICPAPPVLQLKIGAQVMLLRNLDTNLGLVNGARGVVERMTGEGNYPHVRFFVKTANSGSRPKSVEYTVQPERWSLRHGDGQVLAYRRQLPLDLAWAISIHKSQGVSLDSAELALTKVFECGQAYVALSRCRTLAGLRLLDWRPEAIQANSKVKLFYRALRQTQAARERGEYVNSDSDHDVESPIKRVCR